MLHFRLYLTDSSAMPRGALRHNIKPVIERFRFDQVNEAIAHLRSGKAQYRIVLAK